MSQRVWRCKEKDGHLTPLSTNNGGQSMTTQLETEIVEMEKEGPVVTEKLHMMGREASLAFLNFKRTPLVWNGKVTGREIISKGEDYVTVQSPGYVILPNEYVASGADDIAERMHLRVHKSIETPTRMWRYYLGGERFGPNKELDIGFFVANSIDGSQALSVGAFMWRQICSNGMMAKRLIVGLRMVHSSGMENLDFNLLLQSTERALNLSRSMAVSMQDWDKLAIHDHPQGDLFVQLLRSSPLPNTMRPDYLALPNKRLPASEIPALNDSVTMWEVYNDFTSIITHSEVSERTKVEYQHQLHKALSPLYNLSFEQPAPIA